MGHVWGMHGASMVNYGRLQLESMLQHYFLTMLVSKLNVRDHILIAKFDLGMIQYRIFVEDDDQG